MNCPADIFHSSPAPHAVCINITNVICFILKPEGDRVMPKHAGVINDSITLSLCLYEL